MKYPTLLLALAGLLVNFPVAAQYVASARKNNLKIGAGYAQVGGLNGVQYYNEYNRKLTAFLSVAPSVSFAVASSPETDLFFTHNSLFAADVNLYFTPIQLLNQLGVLKWRNHNLKLGGGVGRKYLTQSRFTGSSRVGMPPDQFSFEKKKSWSTGFSVVVEYEWSIADKWVLGPRASVQTFDGGEAVDFLGFNAGIRF